MLSLALDTSTPAGSLAILDGSQVLGALMTSSAENYSTRMFRHLDFLLGELQLKIADFDLFSVNSGPGSFTGLRVGLTAVKGWAELYGKPVAAITGLEALAEGVHAPGSLIASVLDARRGELYGALYRRLPAAAADTANPFPGEWQLERIGEETVMPSDKFIAYVQHNAANNSVVFATLSPGMVAKALKESPAPDWPIEQISNLLAPAIGRIGYSRAKRGEVVDALHLDANYIRRSDAELLWKGP
jgi:tRNA threonylcarbamoyl adenosine modification protein YeaZ